MSQSDANSVGRWANRSGKIRSIWAYFLSCHVGVVAILSGAGVFAAEPADAEVNRFTKQHCTSCHNGVDREGGLDLNILTYAPGDAENFLTWVKVHDRVQSGEMPPKDAERPESVDIAAFIKALGTSLTAADKQIVAREGR